MTSLLQNLIYLYPEVVLALSILVFILVGAIRGEKVTEILYYTAALVLIGLGIASLFGLNGQENFAFNKHFVIDDYTLFAKCLVFITSGTVLLMARSYFQHFYIDRFEFPILVLFATLGMSVMISSNSLLVFYLGLELQSLTLYVMASIHRDNLKSTEAGLKYFVLGALASGIILYGSSLIYGFTGTTNFTDLAMFFQKNPDVGIPVLVGFVFFISGLAFKVSAVPFHMWTPDVYEGSPTPITAFFATAAKLTALLVFIRVTFEPFSAFFDKWQAIIVVLSIASMAFASIAAIAQTNFKRLLAYSSIGHIGYAFVGVAVGTELALQSVVTYIIIYIFMSMGVFACLLLLRQQGRMVEKIEDFAGMVKSNPVIAVPMVILMFSMAGIPPLAGFFAKFYVFMAAIEAKLYLLAVFGILTSVIAAFYYLRVVKLMLFDEPIEETSHIEHKPALAILFISSAFNMLFILYPSLFSNFVEQAVIALK